MIVALAFATPLISLTGVNGSTICFWSKETGRGKSTLGYLQQSVWMAPKRARINSDDTINAMHTRMGSMSGFTTLWDDLLNRMAERIREMFMRVPQGRDKQRLGSDAQLREAELFETILCILANFNPRGIIAGLPGSDAALMRCASLEMPPVGSGSSQVDVMGLEQFFDTNHGHMGHRFASYVVGRQDEVKDRCQGVLERMLSHARTGAGDVAPRFLAALGAAMIVGAEYAVRAGMPCLRSDLIEDRYVDYLHEVRAERQAKGYVASASVPFTHYLSEFARQSLNLEWDPQRHRYRKAADHPLVNPPFAYSIDRTHRRILLDAQRFDAWMLEKGMVPEQVLRTMRALVAMRETHSTLTLGVASLPSPKIRAYICKAIGPLSGMAS
jgi:hypothetical protein